MLTRANSPSRPLSPPPTLRVSLFIFCSTSLALSRPSQEFLSPPFFVSRCLPLSLHAAHMLSRRLHPARPQHWWRQQYWLSWTNLPAKDHLSEDIWPTQDKRPLVFIHSQSGPLFLHFLKLLFFFLHGGLVLLVSHTGAGRSKLLPLNHYAMWSPFMPS